MPVGDLWRVSGASRGTGGGLIMGTISTAAMRRDLGAQTGGFLAALLHDYRRAPAVRDSVTAWRIIAVARAELLRRGAASVNGEGK